MAVGAHLPRALQPDPGVVDQDVEALVVAPDGLRQGPDIIEGSEIRGVESGARPSPDLRSPSRGPSPARHPCRGR